MKDITLPYELATKDLSLREIGTVFTLLAVQKMSQEEVSRWAKDDEYLDTIETLVNRECIIISYDENDDVRVTIDLGDKEPEPFWELYGYGENDNPIYSHPSNYGTDEDGPWYYKIKPVLRDLKIVWVDCSDKDLQFELDMDYVTFDSLEEAEDFYIDVITVPKIHDE